MTFQTGSLAAFARRHGVSKQTATDWKQRGLLVFDSAGKLDFAASDRALRDHGIRQPVDARVDESRTHISKPVPSNFAILNSIADPFERGVAVMALSLMYESGRVAANCAVDCGADMKTAFSLNEAVRLSTAVLVQHLAQKLGVPALSGDAAAFVDPKGFSEPDWDLLAEAAGEPLDITSLRSAWAATAAAVFNE